MKFVKLQYGNQSVNEGRQRDDSAGSGCAVLGPEFNSWDPHGGKRELQGHAGLHPTYIDVMILF